MTKFAIGIVGHFAEGQVPPGDNDWFDLELFTIDKWIIYG